jgi:hypothetical protein
MAHGGLHCRYRTAIGRLSSRLLLLVVAASVGAAETPVDFARDIRPILSETCFKCHGFDGEARATDMRLDSREGLLAHIDAGPVVQPGAPEASQLYLRITADDPELRMPPADSKLSLTAEQIGLLRQWIAEGAEWRDHWSLLPIVPPDVPHVDLAGWGDNPIDAFVLAGLGEAGLEPAPEAEPARLLRRVSLDLTGLAPSLDLQARFLNANSPLTYEQVVDELLASPQFGERMAWDWLDAARYADSNGYQGDGERTMWPWRDWVVTAFNENLPYDEFTVWQLAGDLLPEATDTQRLATGFCRNHMINGEGGRIAEENRVDYVMDMTETMGTVWLGLTFNCCRCHDHKFDRLTNRDYYALTAYFNQTPVDGGGGNPQTPPVLTVFTDEARARQTAIDAELAQVRQRLEERAAVIEPEQSAWEVRQLADIRSQPWQVLEPISATAEKQQLSILPDGSVFAQGDPPNQDAYTVTTDVPVGRIVAIRLEALQHESHTGGALAKSDSGNFVLTDFKVSLEFAEESGAIHSQPLVFSGAVATYEQGGLTAASALDGDTQTGWAVHEGRTVDRPHAAVFTLAAPLDVVAGQKLTFSLRHDSPHIKHNLGRFRLSITSHESAPAAVTEDRLLLSLTTPADERTDEQRRTLAEAHHQSDEAYRGILADQSRLENERKNLADGAPRVMVMADLAQPRKTFMLSRGLYNEPGEEVSANVPAALPPLDASLPNNRLGLARWLVSQDNPLTARVTVNRLWQQFFGIGLVKTPEDFGVQGEIPRHAALLDWLAHDFRAHGWDVKRLVRQIVTSRVYRQSSRVSRELYERDPENRLLARGARYRLPAWMLRDQALAASGLLVDQRGGPPVNTYQPAGVWEEATFGGKAYRQDSGEALYRRSLYTFWRRIIGPTMFFDSAARQVCTVKQVRTNTPLHALSLLNDVTYVEAARALAQLTLQQSLPSDAERVDFAFRRVLARPATANEQAVLLAGLARSRLEYAGDSAARDQLLAQGESERDTAIDPVEHAAWTAVCLALLNLDEAVTRE